MNKPLQKIYFLPLGDFAQYACMPEALSKTQLEDRLRNIANTVLLWDYQTPGDILFVSPAPINELSTATNKIKRFTGKVYIAPNDEELELVQKLFKNSPNVVLLYSNTPNFVGDHLDRLIDTLVCEDVRVKFKASKQVSLDLWEKAVNQHWQEFNEAGKILGATYNQKPMDGSLSMRTENGFLITATKTDKNNITKDDLTLVTSCDDESCTYQGHKLPSSETRLHANIYRAFPDTQVIVHSHHRPLTTKESLEHLRTQKFVAYGTKELSNAAVEKLKQTGQPIVILRHHGEIVMAKKFQKAFSILSSLE